MARERESAGVVLGLIKRPRAKANQLLQEQCARITRKKPSSSIIRPVMPAYSALIALASNPARQFIWKNRPAGTVLSKPFPLAKDSGKLDKARFFPLLSTV